MPYQGKYWKILFGGTGQPLYLNYDPAHCPDEKTAENVARKNTRLFFLPCTVTRTDENEDKMLEQRKARNTIHRFPAKV